VVHVVLHCPALAAKVWPALLSFLAGLGLNRLIWQIIPVHSAWQMHGS